MKKVVACMLGILSSAPVLNATEMYIRDIVNNSKSDIKIIVLRPRKKSTEVIIEKNSNKTANVTISDDSTVVIKLDDGTVRNEVTQNDLKRKFGYAANIKNLKITMDPTYSVVFERVG